MPTSFEAIYLGVLPILDPAEGNQNLSQSAVNAWLGTYGGAGDKLSQKDNIVDFAPGSIGFAGGDPASYDLDNQSSNDTFSINGGADQTHDATMVFNAIITYGDGTTATITAVITQDSDGNAYWVPETTENADHDAIEAAGDHGGIQSLELVSPIYASGQLGRGYGLTADRADTNFMPCFGSGTLIETDRGHVPIETLRVGDLVRTQDNGLQPIRWIGSRTVQAVENLAPIVFKKGAIGNAREMILSAQHRVLVRDERAALLFGEEEVLVAAQDLVDGDMIFRRIGGTVSYFHLMFDQHQIIFSEGAPTESFYPGELGLGAIGELAREELFAIFPELRFGVDSYPPAVRKGLKAHEAALLVA